MSDRSSPSIGTPSTNSAPRLATIGAAGGTPIVTLEENVLAGGFGSAVSEYYTSLEESPNVVRLGIPDEFAGQASRSRLLERYGLDAVSIAGRVRKLVHDYAV